MSIYYSAITKYFVGIYVVYNGKKVYCDGRWDVTLKMPDFNENPSPEIKN